LLASEFGAIGYVQVAAIAAFASVVAGRTIMLRVRRRINPITLRLNKRGWLGVAEVALFIKVNLWIAAVLAYVLRPTAPFVARFYGPQLIGGSVARAFGGGLIVLGLTLFGLGLIALGDSWRLGVDESGSARLVIGGVYAISRNPIYLFFDLWFVGTFLANGVTLFLVFAILTIANLHYQILEEEKWLAAVHGQAYEAYSSRVPRYLGLLALSRGLTRTGSSVGTPLTGPGTTGADCPCGSDELDLSGRRPGGKM
jgi:protein-S-isoprenylcysteine O-methyltransferase Ste14